MENIFKFKFLVLSLVLSLSACENSAPWPENGKLRIVKMIQIPDFAFDCYSSRWAKDNAERLNLISNLGSLGTNKECKFEAKDIYWREYPEAVNATFRCEKDNIIGEYSVSVFKSRKTTYGDYFCSTAHFPSTEKHKLGSVTNVLEIPY